MGYATGVEKQVNSINMAMRMKEKRARWFQGSSWPCWKTCPTRHSSHPRSYKENYSIIHSLWLLYFSYIRIMTRPSFEPTTILFVVCSLHGARELREVSSGLFGSSKRDSVLKHQTIFQQACKLCAKTVRYHKHLFCFTFAEETIFLHFPQQVRNVCVCVCVCVFFFSIFIVLHVPFTKCTCNTTCIGFLV